MKRHHVGGARGFEGVLSVAKKNCRDEKDDQLRGTKSLL